MTGSAQNAPSSDPTTASTRGGVIAWLRTAHPVVVTALAILSAIVVGGLLIALTDDRTTHAMTYFFSYPWDTFTFGWEAIWEAYKALFEGAIFNPSSISSGSMTQMLSPISETLVTATPLILVGLSVGLAFRSGLFNIGGQGQIIMGAICAGFVGFAWNLPPGLHLLLAVVAGVMGGALWGGLAGWLKARTGAHEVITTIMLNYIALYFLQYLLSISGFQRPGSNQAISKIVYPSARLPHLLGPDLRLHAGLLVALAATAGVSWLLTRSTTGFQLRAVGANPNAARTAGMRVERSFIIVMVLAGALAGLAGCTQILGTNTAITGDIDAGFGFDGITVALLGRANPWGTVLAGLLFGGLKAGGLAMQSRTSTPVDLVTVLQALVVLFVAAPALVSSVFRLKPTGEGVSPQLAKGWNG
ncbi:MAG TPA: ABC transporter permease [Actinomycetes bacterium]|nr:ABC transporter permease [Actinomycetes bacterium]